METIINTYIPWGIIAVCAVICFYINLIDNGRTRESTNPYDHATDRKLEFSLILGILVGVVLCYSVLPLPILWGIALGMVCGLVVGLFRRKHGK